MRRDILRAAFVVLAAGALWLAAFVVECRDAMEGP